MQSINHYISLPSTSNLTNRMNQSIALQRLLLLLWKVGPEPRPHGAAHSTATSPVPCVVDRSSVE